MATERKITETDNLIVEALRGAAKPLTFAELKELITLPTGKPLAAAHITHAMSNHLVEKADEIEVLVPKKSKVATYLFDNDAIATKADGKPYNYSENENAILANAKTLEGEFTIADFNETFKTEFKPGTFTSLVKKGNLTKGDEREITKLAKAKKQTYTIAE